VWIGEHDLETSCRLAGERNVIVGIRPSYLQLGQTGIPARVDLIENLGDALLIDLNYAGSTLRARTSTEAAIREGDAVFFTARPDQVHLFDADTHVRLDDTER
jgi:ABC-type sugar transport system ATPase subunit